MDKAGLLGDNLRQGRNNYKSGGFFHGLFSALKIKYCSTKDIFRLVQEHRSFMGFNDSKRLLDRSHFFKMIEGENISAMLPRSWKQSFNSAVVIPGKTGFCYKYIDK